MDVSEFGVKDDVKFCEWMTQHVGVAAVPGSSFFREDIHSLVRFHFAKKDNTLNAALDNLSSLRKNVLMHKMSFGDNNFYIFLRKTHINFLYIRNP